MSQLWVPVVIVVVIGLIAGLGLAIASILLAVPKDEKAEAIEEMLPGANCGACGFSGCSGYAKALAHGEAKPGLCAPGGAEVAKTVSQYLGLADVAVEAKVAVVKCLGSYDNTSDKMEYEGIQSCTAAAQLAGGVSSCRYGCMGMGDCVQACAYGAIEWGCPCRSIALQGVFHVCEGMSKASYHIGSPKAAGDCPLQQLRQGCFDQQGL